MSTRPFFTALKGALGLTLLNACGHLGPSDLTLFKTLQTAPTATPLQVVAVSILPPASQTLRKGKSLNLKAEVRFSNDSATRTATWSVNDSSLASVDASGQVKALKAGTVTVTAQSGALSAQVNLTIVNPVVFFGGRLVYTANQDLYLMQSSNQTPLALTSNGSTVQERLPRLAWDGSSVAFTTPTREVFTLSSSGGTPVNHNFTPNGTDPHPYYYNQGELIFQGLNAPFSTTPTVYLKMTNGTTVPASTALGQIQSFGGVDNDGIVYYEEAGQIKRVLYTNVATKVTLGPGQNPNLAKNLYPSRVVYENGGDLYTANAAGEITQLTNTPDVIESRPALSPDQSQVVFVSNREGNQDLWLINLNGTGLVNLTNTPSVDEDMPDWSV